MFNYLGFILLLKLCSSHDASTVKDIDNGSELLGLSKQSRQQGESQLAAQDGVRDSITKLPGPHLQSQVVAKSGVETNINEPHLKSSYFSNTNLKNSVSDMKIMQLTAENVIINKTLMLPASPSSSSLVSSVENSAITQTEPVIIENSNSYSRGLSSNLHSSTSASVFSTDGTHILSTSTPSMPVKLSSTSSALSKSNSNTVTVHLNSNMAKSSSSTPSISTTSDLSPSNTQISAMPLASASSAIPMTNGSSMATKLSPVLPTLSSMEKIANATSISVTSPVLTQILTASSAPSTPVPSSIHWKTVTVCPWDSLYPASALQSVITSSQESLSSNLSLASTASLSTMITPIILSSAISESSVITQSHTITQSSVISPSAAWTPILVPSYSVISNQSDIKPIARKGCRVVLDGLSQAMGNMTFCILNNLRPLEVCGKCTKVYSEMQEYQSLIAKTANCENELVLEFNSQYQAIPKMYAFQNDLWNDFECEKCYEERPKGTPYAPWNPRSQFAQSAVLVKQIMTCFANYSNGISVPYPVMLNVSQRINSTSWKSTTQICSKCKHLYREIKKYMKSIHYEGSADKRWCADMVYGFNETRRIWGAICVPEKKNSESIIALTCFFCFIPVIFYIGTKLHSDVKERKNDSRVNYESE